jgi:hypothetical protein
MGLRRIVRSRLVFRLRCGLLARRHFAAGLPSDSGMAASGATVVALLLTRAHRLLLSGRVNGFHLLPLPLMNLLDFVPLLRDGKRRVRAHRLPFLPRLLCEDAQLLHRRLGNSGDLPAGFDRRLRRT